jgi:hypothetical protein
MRGRPEDQTSTVMLITLESRVPKDHPIRRIKALADEALRALSPLFDEMYRDGGRPSVPPERLLKRRFSGNALMENRSGLLVDFRIEAATGTAERDAALTMLEALRGEHRLTLGADRGYDTKDFVDACRDLGATPHIAQNTSKRRSAVDARTTRHPGYEVSQRVRRCIESIFGWMKTTGAFDRTPFRGIARTQLAAHFVGAAYNLLRMARLLAT